MAKGRLPRMKPSTGWMIRSPRGESFPATLVTPPYSASKVRLAIFRIMRPRVKRAGEGTR
jgi:hypothetical protein